MKSVADNNSNKVQEAFSQGRGQRGVRGRWAKGQWAVGSGRWKRVRMHSTLPTRRR